MLTMVVRGLPRSMTQDSLEKMFATHGRVYELKIAKDLFSGECKGFAQLKMEGHHARAAIAALNNSEHDGVHVRVSLADDKKPPRRGR